MDSKNLGNKSTAALLNMLQIQKAYILCPAGVGPKGKPFVREGGGGLAKVSAVKLFIH